MNLKSLQQQIIKQEELLRFEHFSNEDALEIGMLLIEKAKSRNAAVAIDISINGYQVFRYGFKGTNAHNDKWLKRKINTVNTVHKSSLHVFTILQEKEQDLLKDWFLDPMEYACMGGGFPIHIKETGIIGCIGVSGLPHLEDHQMIVDVLCDYLKVNLKA
ncbi:heme-degrading domain-containing protein [Cellulosilyticum sp. I15G10I2]|uniref:heme-degrading domain-containing protein n=1 Tax=Cellulosilyticum sp. I15G10I2 TaxID=1892843 RepID=UPI001495D4A5|nr:heme-degrading domain-containing protein [Cellulosilyticum sp. I15G10I2]